MFGLRTTAALLLCLLASAPAYANNGEILNLSIPAPDQLGMGTALNSGNGIIWNGPRVEAANMTPAAPVQLTQPQLALNAAMTLAPRDLPAHDNSLFGHQGVVSGDTTAFTKWNDVIAREHQELAGAHSPATTTWLSFLETLRGLSRAEQLAAVNSYANRIAYISDADNYGQTDHWATTAEFLSRGGDCEDYAIAKYMSLQLLGFPTDQMRVVILFDQQKQERHAVLAVDDGNSVKILDNQNRNVVAAIDIDHYQPIYAISQTNWWRYV